jgi:hypothetical protein
VGIDDSDPKAVRSDRQRVIGKDRSGGIGLDRPAFRRGRATRRLSHPRNRSATRKRPSTREWTGASAPAVTKTQIAPITIPRAQDITWGTDSVRGILCGIGCGLLLWALIAGVVVALLR